MAKRFPKPDAIVPYTTALLKHLNLWEEPVKKPRPPRGTAAAEPEVKEDQHLTPLSGAFLPAQNNPQFVDLTPETYTFWKDRAIQANGVLKPDAVEELLGNPLALMRLTLYPEILPYAPPRAPRFVKIFYDGDGFTECQETIINDVLNILVSNPIN